MFIKFVCIQLFTKSNCMQKKNYVYVSLLPLNGTER